MKKAPHKQPVLPADHTPEEERLRKYADKINPLAEVIKKSKSRKEARTATNSKRKLRDVRLPLPGSVLEKDFKGRRLVVKVLEFGFEYENKYYKTLSGVAVAITGHHISGYHFFGL